MTGRKHFTDWGEMRWCLSWSIQISERLAPGKEAWKRTDRIAALFCISETVFPEGPHPNSVLSEPVLPDGLSISNEVKSDPLLRTHPKLSSLLPLHGVWAKSSLGEGL